MTTTISDDGKWLAIGTSGGVVELWNVETGKLAHAFKGDDTVPITHLAFAGDESLLAAAGEGRGGAGGQTTIRIWNTAIRRQEHVFEDACGPVAFTSDGCCLISI